MDSTDQKEESEIEICRICSKPTEYNIADNIMARVGYIEGFGQVCSKCMYSHQQYKNNEVTDILFDI